MSSETKIFIFMISAVLLVVGCFNVSYGYYNFLRLTTSLTALLAIYEWREETLLKVLFILIAVLYNPILPNYLLNKDIWVYADCFIAGLFMERSISIYQKNIS